MRKRFRIPARINNNITQPWVEIIGVVGHVKHDGLDLDTRPQIYWNYEQRPQDRMVLVARAADNVAALTPAIIQAIHDVDPEQPVYDVRTMAEVVERSLGQRWLNMTLIGAFATVALVLCSIGVYGVVAFGVTRQRREFGIRLALGASRRGRDVGAQPRLAARRHRHHRRIGDGRPARAQHELDAVRRERQRRGKFRGSDGRDPNRRCGRQLSPCAARRRRRSCRHSSR